MKSHSSISWQRKGFALVMHSRLAARRIYGCYCRVSDSAWFAGEKRKSAPSLASVNTAISGHNCAVFMLLLECPEHWLCLCDPKGDAACQPYAPCRAQGAYCAWPWAWPRASRKQGCWMLVTSSISPKPFCLHLRWLRQPAERAEWTWWPIKSQVIKGRVRESH